MTSYADSNATGPRSKSNKRTFKGKKMTIDPTANSVSPFG